MKRNDVERQNHIALVEFCNRYLRQLIKDEKVKFNHCPNGGKRNVIEARLFKLMGVSPGYPDLVFFAPYGKFGGLVIELKTAEGKVSAEQQDWLDFFESINYQVWVCRSFEEGKQKVEGYFFNMLKENGYAV